MERVQAVAAGVLGLARGSALVVEEVVGVDVGVGAYHRRFSVLGLSVSLPPV